MLSQQAATKEERERRQYDRDWYQRNKEKAEREEAERLEAEEAARKEDEERKKELNRQRVQRHREKQKLLKQGEMSTPAPTNTQDGSRLQTPLTENRFPPLTPLQKDTARKESLARQATGRKERLTAFSKLIMSFGDLVKEQEADQKSEESNYRATLDQPGPDPTAAAVDQPYFDPTFRVLDFDAQQSSNGLQVDSPLVASQPTREDPAAYTESSSSVVAAASTSPPAAAPVPPPVPPAVAPVPSDVPPTVVPAPSAADSMTAAGPSPLAAPPVAAPVPSAASSVTALAGAVVPIAPSDVPSPTTATAVDTCPEASQPYVPAWVLSDDVAAKDLTPKQIAALGMDGWHAETLEEFGDLWLKCFDALDKLGGVETRYLLLRFIAYAIALHEEKFDVAVSSQPDHWTVKALLAYFKKRNWIKEDESWDALKKLVREQYVLTLLKCGEHVFHRNLDKSGKLVDLVKAKIVRVDPEDLGTFTIEYEETGASKYSTIERLQPWRGERVV